MNLKEVYHQILSLPDLRKVQNFEETYTQALSSLKGKKFGKSLEYLENVYNMKEKWARACAPDKFTAGVRTTSCIESVNSVIKKYVNSNSEICDIFDFVVGFEKAVDQKVSKENNAEKEEEIIPLLDKFKRILSPYIYDLHHEQFQLAARYVVDEEDLKSANLQRIHPTFRLTSLDAKDEKKIRIVFFLDSKYSCDCYTFVQQGIVCRHILCISNMRQEKDLINIRIYPRWLNDKTNNHETAEILFRNDVPQENFSPEEEEKVPVEEIMEIEMSKEPDQREEGERKGSKCSKQVTQKAEREGS